VAGLSAFTFLVALIFLPESLKAESRKKVLKWLEANPFGALAALGRYPLVRSLSWTVLFNGLAMNMLIAVWIPYFTYRYNFGPTENGLTLALFGLVTAVGQAVIVPWLVPRLGERRSILFGLGVSVLSFVAYGLAFTPWVLFVTLVIGSLAAVDEPASQALISKNVRDDEQGTIQGALSTIGSLMGVLGPPLGTFLFSQFSGAKGLAEVPGMPFFVGAVCVALGMLLAYRALNKHGIKH
jgi:MFS transporter, DHA1 family, tetracycline resistance protein